MSTIEVYPHPALITLLKADYRLPYKVSKSNKYWPHTDATERAHNLLAKFTLIRQALGAEFLFVDGCLPLFTYSGTLTSLKRYEDALDALVSAWVGVKYLWSSAIPYGDEEASIWIPC